MAIGGLSKSRNLLAINRLQKRQSVRRVLLETLEPRHLMAVGPQLIGIQPNTGDLLQNGEVLQVSPRELVFRFNDGAGIDPATLGGIRVVRSGEDGVFERASVATDLGTGGQTLVEFYAQTPGQAGNGIQLRFTTAVRTDTRDPVLRVSGRQIDIELNTNPSLTTRVEDLLRVFDRNAGTAATSLVFALPLRGSQTIAIGTTVDTSRTLVLSGANAAKASTNFGLGNNLEVRFVARDGGSTGLGTRINVTSVDRGGAGLPVVTVSGKTINVVLNSNPRFATTAREFVDAINANTAAASLLEAQLVSGSGATRIGAASTAYSPIILTGVTDIEVIPGYIGLGANNREVVLRFAEPLPDDSYRIEILGQGIRTLRNLAGEPFNMGVSSSVAFELELGAQILSVVPQPVTRDPSTGAISWTRKDEIDIYFSHDQLIDVKSVVSVNGLTLTQLKAERAGVLYFQNSDTIVFAGGRTQRGVLDPEFYQLIDSKGTLDTSDDVAAEKPTRIRYYPDADRVSLRFQKPLDEFATNGGELRLRVGTSEQGLAAPVVFNAASDPADTFAGSLDLTTAAGTPWSSSSTGSQSILINSTIENTTPFVLDFPGGNDEPGTRQIRMQSNLRLGADNVDGISTIFYNFQGQLGTFGGSALLNAITEQQKVRVREVMSLYEQYLGIRFVESPSLGMTIAVGDMRAITPFPDVAGGPAGVVEGNQPGFTAYEAGTLSSGQPATVLDSQDFASSTVNNFGGTFTRAAMQAIGKLLGLGDSDELEQLTVQSSNAIFAPGVGTEIVLPGDADIVHGQYLYRPDSRDIDLYQFRLPVAGKLSIEAFAERMSSASLLDSQIRLFQETSTGWNEIAANDDYFSSDSFLELELGSGNYIVGVSASGNSKYDPSAPDSGLGGRSQGNYQLRMDFQPPAPSVLRDADSGVGTAVDGDGDGTPGGVFNFWFRPSNEATTKFVDKSAPSGGTGSIVAPYNKLSDALDSARTASLAGTPGVVVRVLGNGGADKNFATQADNLAYEIGFDSLGAPLADGTTFDVPKDVTVMIDAGAILKFRRARVGVGSTSVSVDRSGGALLVLGTPTLQTAAGTVLTNSAGAALSGSVVMTSFNDVSLGKTIKTPTSATNPGDWGGIDIRNRVDNSNGNEYLENAGIFLNWVSNADIRYGGGQVVVDGVSQVVSPIQMVDSRPTIISNSISNSADAALSATPNSFLESNFNSPAEQGVVAPFTVDYDRVGPEIHGNRLQNNTVNGLQVRVRTNSSTQLEKLTTQGRFDDIDIVHYLPENLEISGTPGGALLVQTSTTSEQVSRLDARLVIDPSTIVKSQGARVELAFGSQLIAEGTPGNPVVFTSINDVRYGAGGTFDTGNRKGTQTVSPGDWGGIFVGQTSKASLDNAVVAYGGGTTRIEGGFADFGSIEVHQGDLRLVNSTIENNADGVATSADPNRGGRGTNSAGAVFIRGAQPIIVDNIIRDNQGPAISANLNSLNSVEVVDAGRSRGRIELVAEADGNQGPLLRGNLMSNNTLNGLVVRGGNLTTEGVWDDTDIVHIVLDEIIVPNFQTYGGLRLQSSPTQSLVVKLRSSANSTAGFTATGKPLDIADRIGGSVRIVGTPGKPVILTSLSDNSVSAGFTSTGTAQQQTDQSATAAAAGDWRSIRLETNSNDRNVATVLENESAAANSPNANGTPANSQYLGGLAPSEFAGDENRRLGFEVHGAISSPTDQDVYSFEAQAGTEVWLDIDRTQNTLDTIVELVDADGRTLAMSDNSLDEEANPSLLVHVAEIPAESVNPLRLSTPELYLQSATGAPKDLYSTNPRDAGFRVSLPGGTGTTNLYHIRVRSNGTTKGTYQLQVRLSEVDEVPGSSVNYADIRFASTGLQLIGVPANSPLLGEGNETESKAGGNNTFATAQDLGNLLQTNRQALSVSGNLDSTTDVDWFSFDIDYQSIRPTSIREYFSTILDVDYADGLGRPDTSIYVFDSRGYLILGGLGSDLVDDQASPLNGADNSDLSRGSAGNLDPYVDSYELPAGRYFVAVTNSSRIPEAMDQFTTANATNPLVRLQPIEGVQLIAEDHVSFNGGSTAAGPIVSDLFVGNAAAVPWTLGDIVLYVSRDAGAQTNLFTVNPFTGETAIAFNNQQPFDVEDIAFRPNGELRAFDRGLIGPQPADLDTSVDYINIDTGTGTYTATANALGLQTFHNVQTITTNPGPPPTVTITNTPTASDDGIHPEAITFANILNQEFGFLAGNRNPNPAALPTVGTARPDVQNFRNIIYQFNEATGAAEGAVKTGNLVYTGAGTDITERGFIETSAPVGAVSTTLVAKEATTTAGGFRSSLLSDGDTFTIRDLTGPVAVNRVFEFDFGPEVIVNYNPSAGLGVRDGMRFTLDGTSYEFDTGNVVVVDATSGSLLSDGATVTLTNAAGVSRTYEFDSNGALAGAGNIAVPFAAGTTQSGLAQALVTAVNSDRSFGIRAGTVTGSGRVSFLGASTTIPVVITGTGLSVAGNLGVAGGVRIPILESATESEFIAAIATAMPATISASFDSGRMNFSGAMSADFGDLATTGIFNVLRTSSGVGAASRIPINVQANDSAETVAKRIAAAVNGLAVVGLSATASGTEVRFFAASIVSAGPLKAAGVAPGGLIKGIAVIGNTLYAVSDAGGLYFVNNPQARTGGSIGTYVTTSSDLLGINFTGLVAGPADTSLTGGRRVLFGIDSGGRIHAFDTSGVLQPVFANGATSISTGLTGANGLALSTLQSNLWSQTNPNDNTNREGDAGHGLLATPNGSRGSSIGDTSYYFGDNTAVNYNFPGGAAGALESTNFSLAGLSAADLPMLYFNYFLNSENTNGVNMEDAFRVYASGEDGNWQLLATNNSDPLRELAISPDVQELFDNTGGWRQARVPLDRFAGQENIRLRVEFSTGAGFGYGRTGGTGPELRIKAGNDLLDGQVLSLNGEQFEIEMGPTLTLPARASISNGQSVTIDGIRYVFTDGTGPAVVAPNVAVNLTPTTLTAEDVALALQAAVSSVTAVVPVVAGLSFNENNDVIARANASGITGETIRVIGSGTIGDRLTDPDRDVDMVRIELRAGASLLVNANTTSIGSALNSVLRLFDSEGREVARSAAGAGSSQLNFVAVNGGTYYVGVSGSGNQTYDAVIPGLTSVGSTGNYELRIEVQQPLTTAVDGNRLQLLGASVVSVSAGTQIGIQGAAGTNGLPVRITANMTANQVATVLQTAIANRFANGVSSVYPLRSQDTLGLTGLTVTNAGPFGLTTQFPGANFTTFNSPARAQNNNFEGVYVDDFIIGIAGRGEMVLEPRAAGTGVAGDVDFIANPDATNQILTGPYQFEIRGGEEYGRPTTGGFVLQQTFPLNDRSAPGLSIRFNDASQLVAGRTFTVGDGPRVVTFELDDVNDGVAVAAGHVALPYSTAVVRATGETVSETAEIIAARFRDLLNSPAIQELISVTGNLLNNDRFGATSDTVVLIGNATADVPSDVGQKLVSTNTGGSNRKRPQGQIVINGVRVSDSATFGATVEAAARDATTNAPQTGSPRNTITLNTEQLTTGAVIMNSEFLFNASGGISVTGDPQFTTVGAPDGSQAFVRLVNNTIVGGSIAGGATPTFTAGGIGINVTGNATATVLNNVVVNSAVGINVDASSDSTVIGGTVYQLNGANVGGVATLGQFPSTPGSSTQIFQDIANRNLYPAAGSAVIDSSIDSLEDRLAIVAVKEPLGLSASPILSPDFDINGQLRVDDPTVDTPAGLGERVFKDRGAQDRADFAGPSLVLLNPVDNDFGGLDSNPADGIVELTGGTLRYFDILLEDGLEPSDPSRGAGVDHSTVNSNSVLVFGPKVVDGVRLQNQPLIEGRDYVFGYDSTNGIIRLTPLAGIWEPESVYTVRFLNTVANAFVAQANYTDGEQISIVDSTGKQTLFELDFGYVVTVPAPPADPTTLDGVTFVVDDGAKRVVFEIDIDGLVTTGNTGIDITSASNSEGVARLIQSAINNALLNLTVTEIAPGVLQIQGSRLVSFDPVDSGLIVVGQPGVQTEFGIQIPQQAGLPFGLADGQTFTIDRTGTPVTFELDTNGVVQSGNQAVTFAVGASTNTIADALVSAIQAAALGLTPVNAGSGLVTIGGDSATVLDMSQTALAQSGLPGQPAAMAISVSAAIQSSETFAALIKQAIDAQNLPGVVTTLFGDRILVEGATSASGVGAVSINAIRDLAGNPIKSNQADGSTEVTIFLGEGLDYGDAPAPYISSSNDNGPRHTVLNSLSLGATVSADADARVPNADTDDGVSISTLLAASTGNATISVNNTTGNTAYVSMWIDFNGNGVFSDTERVAASLPITGASTTVTFAIPRSTMTDPSTPSRVRLGDTYARVRLSTNAAAVASSTGAAPDGEVEDYPVTIQASALHNASGIVDGLGNGLDVNNDGSVSAIDVLQVVNWINNPPSGPVSPTRFVDVTGDGVVSAQDVLTLVNFLNSQPRITGGGEGEASRSTLDSLAEGEYVFASNWAGGLEDLLRPRLPVNSQSALSIHDQAILDSEDNGSVIAAAVAPSGNTRAVDQFWAGLSDATEEDEALFDSFGEDQLKSWWN